MSHTVYLSDYIIITGDLVCYETISADTNYGSLGRLTLNFTIQINGKLKSFSHNFQLDKSETSPEQLGLKNYQEWYVLYETLGELGYKIGDYSSVLPQNGNIINNWIEELEDLILEDKNTTK